MAEERIERWLLGRLPLRINRNWGRRLRRVMPIYTAGVLLLVLINIPFSAQIALSIQDQSVLLRALFGLLGVFVALVFIVMWPLCLYHVLTQRSRGKVVWSMVLVLLSVVGVSLYWYAVLEPARYVDEVLANAA